MPAKYLWYLTFFSTICDNLTRNDFQMTIPWRLLDTKYPICGIYLYIFICNELAACWGHITSKTVLRKNNNCIVQRPVVTKTRGYFVIDGYGSKSTNSDLAGFYLLFYIRQHAGLFRRRTNVNILLLREWVGKTAKMLTTQNNYSFIISGICWGKKITVLHFWNEQGCINKCKVPLCF
jgi:hypothetical protein